MKLHKEWRFWLFVVTLALALLSIGFRTSSGAVVTSISQDSPLADYVLPGERIQAINEQSIRTPEDIERFETHTGVLRIVHDGELSLVNVATPGLGIEVSEASSTNLALGMDLVGGTRVLLEPQYPTDATREEREALARQTITTLETRVNIYGLRELPIRPVTDVNGNTYIQIETPSGTLADIESVVQRQGKFEGFVPREVEWSADGAGVLRVAGTNNTLSLSGSSVVFRGNAYGINETFVANNMTFEVRNVTSLSAQLVAHVFTSEDIKFVYTDAANSYVVNRGDGWEFAFSIILSDAGAQRFADATADLQEVQSIEGRSDCYLSEPIELHLDRTLVSSLNIVCDLRGDVLNQVQITGGSPTEEDALQEMRTLQTVLKSGSLPVALKTVRIDTISPTLGQQFLASVTLAGLLAFAGVTAIVFLRYRRLDVALPMLLISLSEITIILGFAAAIKWTIDLAAIAGVIASIGTGVNDQIVIADEALGKQAYSTKQRIKNAFFIVFGAAATIVAAMIPLAFIGIGVMRGFAVTTIIGVLVGVFITRPFYAKIVESRVKD